jgi:catechol 2,3-dioxygenase-like lactoylglutathione lyase family enzyme
LIKINVDHVALQNKNKNDAIIFYKDVLGLSLIKTFSLNEELSKSIFSINKSVEVLVFQGDKSKFEIFITDINLNLNFNHIGIIINNKEEFFKKCNENNLKPFKVLKGEKELLFVKDFYDNLFEIKIK